MYIYNFLDKIFINYEIYYKAGNETKHVRI